MAKLAVPVGDAAGCARCGGVFLDDPAFGHFRESFYESILKSAPTSGATGAPGATGATGAPGARDERPPFGCPTCGKDMTRTTVGDVEIDLCASHGTWFDKNELILVARSIAHARHFGTPSTRKPTPEMSQKLGESVAKRGLGAAILESLFADDDSLEPLVDGVALPPSYYRPF